MFWTCDERCKVNRRQFEVRQAEYRRLNKDYLQGLSEVRYTRSKKEK